MKRNFGMWMAIICILVVGVSVTRMTREFVVSQGVDTAAIMGVMDTSNVSVAGASMKQALKNQILSSGEAGAGIDGMAPSAQETMLMDGPAEAVPQQPAGPLADLTEHLGSQKEAMPEHAAVTSGEALIENELTAAEAYSVNLENGSGEPDAEVQAASEDTESGENADVEENLKTEAEQKAVSSAPKSPLEPAKDTENPAIQETVKSPLNPVVNDKKADVIPETSMTVYTAELFLERFLDIEESAEAIWQNVTMENHAANLAAAEQERLIWDSELNFVYSAIRDKMTDSEAEHLKILEVEWLKERDLYAEKMAAKSPVKNAQTQNPVYTKALAQKTKERCYWLISEYEDILSRTEKPVEVLTEPGGKPKNVKPGTESGKKVSPQTKN